MKKCENCIYYGRAIDAPDTVEEDCMWEMVRTENDLIERPCEEEEDKE